uniref:Uncharacterized protein n=2 Tax=Leersia perrieri TaxID=77586 RepID=A0A0D9X667_9ORYZ
MGPQKLLTEPKHQEIDTSKQELAMRRSSPLQYLRLQVSRKTLLPFSITPARRNPRRRILARRSRRFQVAGRQEEEIIAGDRFVLTSYSFQFFGDDGTLTFPDALAPSGPLRTEHFDLYASTLRTYHMPYHGTGLVVRAGSPLEGPVCAVLFGQGVPPAWRARLGHTTHARD